MTLEIRPTSEPDDYDLYENGEKIGELGSGASEDDDDEFPPLWSATIWSQMGTGKEWSAQGFSFDEVKEGALRIYEDFVAERRELRKGSRPPTINVPMGGQRRR